MRDMDPQYDGFPQPVTVVPFKECPYCGLTYKPSTVEKLDREKLPCPCGFSTSEFHEFHAPAHAKHITWDEVLELIVDSGLWRCEACGFTATESNWHHTVHGDECISECPDCGAVEDYEVLKLEIEQGGE